MQRNARRHIRVPAFTLVELLVVISVIILLMGMVLPVLMSSTARAREVKCLSNLKQLGIAVGAYATSNDGFLPSPAHVNKEDLDLNDISYYDGDRDWAEAEKRFFYRSHTWRGKIFYYLGGVESKDEMKGYEVYKCPSVRAWRGINVHGGMKSMYGINAYLGMWTNPERLFENEAATIKQFKVNHFDDIVQPTGTFLLGENNDFHWVVKPKFPRNDADLLAGKLSNGQVVYRHNQRQRSSWLYCDGHTEPLPDAKVHDRNCYFWLDVKDEDE